MPRGEPDGLSQCTRRHGTRQPPARRSVSQSPLHTVRCRILQVYRQRIHRLWYTEARSCDTTYRRGRHTSAAQIFYYYRIFISLSKRSPQVSAKHAPPSRLAQPVVPAPTLILCPSPHPHLPCPCATNAPRYSSQSHSRPHAPAPRARRRVFEASRGKDSEPSCLPEGSPPASLKGALLPP